METAADVAIQWHTRRRGVDRAQKEAGVTVAGCCGGDSASGVIGSVVRGPLLDVNVRGAKRADHVIFQPLRLRAEGNVMMADAPLQVVDDREGCRDGAGASLRTAGRAPGGLRYRGSCGAAVERASRELRCRLTDGQTGDAGVCSLSAFEPLRGVQRNTAESRKAIVELIYDVR